MRESVEGTTLVLNFVANDADCNPIEGVEFEIWSTNTDGEYSGLNMFGTVGEWWLRGVQSLGQGGACPSRSEGETRVRGAGYPLLPAIQLHRHREQCLCAR